MPFILFLLQNVKITPLHISPLRRLSANTGGYFLVCCSTTEDCTRFKGFCSMQLVSNSVSSTQAVGGVPTGELDSGASLSWLILMWVVCQSCWVTFFLNTQMTNGWTKHFVHMPFCMSTLLKHKNSLFIIQLSPSLGTDLPRLLRLGHNSCTGYA